MSVMRLTVIHPYTKFEVRRPCRSQDIGDFFSVTALSDLVTLTSKWGHWSPVSRASFLPIFNLRRPSVVDLRVRNGTDRQTDRQTTDRQTTAIIALCPIHPWGGHNKH